MNKHLSNCRLMFFNNSKRKITNFYYQNKQSASNWIAILKLTTDHCATLPTPFFY